MSVFCLTNIKDRILRLLERTQNWIGREGWKTDTELKECLKRAAEEAKAVVRPDEYSIQDGPIIARLAYQILTLEQ